MRSLFLAATFFSTSALACGVCVEDKIAAVYDHAVVTQAAAQKQTVAYFAIDGSIRDSKERLESLIGKMGSLRSVRVSVELSSLAVVFDPRRASVAAVQRAVEEKLRPLGLSLLLLDTK
jgi:copper chaperone CopZ